MKKIKVCVVFGTRPEAIKMAPVIRELKKRSALFTCTVCVTGQHREMLGQALDLFGITADYDLAVMKPDQDLYDVTVRILERIKRVFHKERPDLVLVQGDTTSAFAASMAAYYERIRTGHVEAGLRTGNKWAPFPEEINRCMIARLADLHFAPTAGAAANLRREGVVPGSVFVTGNTIVDALKEITRRLHASAGVKAALRKRFRFLDARKKLLLVTGHRRENFGHGMENICRALRVIAQRFPDLQIVYPVHPNPHVRGPVRRILGSCLNNVFLLDPLDYISFVYLLERSFLVLSDSGGIQEEAPSLHVPVLVMRSSSERPEAIRAGTARLVGTDCRKIVDAVTLLMRDRKKYTAMIRAENPFGDGRAAGRIAAIIAKNVPLHPRSAASFQ